MKWGPQPGFTFLWILAVYIFATSSCLAATNPEIVSVQKIWDKGEHNAFTDLIRFQNKWYCTFREATDHGSSTGVVRVIESNDGNNWRSSALVVEKEIDLRDPKLSIMPDGRLMLIMGGIVNNDDGQQITRAPRVSFSKNGRRWTRPQKVLAEDHWLWRVTWHKGIGYSVSKLGDGKDPRRVMLYKTQDGLEWDWVTEFRNIPAWPNETTVRFLADDEMVALLRRNQTAWIGTSYPPYQKWTWSDTGIQNGGPNFIEIPKMGLWASGRFYSEDKNTTVLARMTRTHYEPVLTFPSGGDNSYAGMVWHENLLWMSYYSSHEGKTSIYLAKISLKQSPP